MTPTTLAGRYVLLDQIGSGGAADVWRAQDLELGVVRAVKILSERAATRQTLRRRLRAEAQILARLNHPHVLRVLDIGMEQGRPFIVMELLEGGSVADMVRREGGISADRAITITLEVLSALAVAHGQGIIHRDIKPQNMLLDKDGRAVVADFGIALIEAGDRRTRTGVAMGSFAFMPPEQRMDAKRVGPSADLYATSCSLFWMLTGKNPIDLFAEADDGARWQGLPPSLVEILRWGTQAEPEDRPQSAAELAARLRDLAPADVQLRSDLDPSAFPEPRSAQAGRTDASTAELSPGVTTVGMDTPIGAPAASVPPAAATTHPPDPDDARPGALRIWLPVLAAIVLAVLIAMLAWRLWPQSEPPPQPPPELSEALKPSTETADPVAATSDLQVPSEALATEAPAGPPATDPAVRVPAPDTAPTSLPTAWSGVFGGNDMALTLSGPSDALTGKVTVRYDGNPVVTPVRGTWNADTAQIVLVDAIDAPDAGRYEATLAQGRLTGTFRSRHRTEGSGAPMILSFTLSPVAP